MDDLKEAKKAQLAAERAERSRISKVKSDASKVLAKVAPPLLQLEEMMADPHAGKVPAVVQKRVKEAIAKLTHFKDESSAKIKMKEPLDLTFGLDDVQAVAKDSCGVIKMMEGMLTTMAKL